MRLPAAAHRDKLGSALGNQLQVTGRAQVAAVLHLDKSQCEWPAAPTRNVDKISTLAFSSCNLFERHNIGHLIEGYQEPLVETWPVRIARARGAAMSVDQRKRHEFSSTGGRIGEANGK